MHPVHKQETSNPSFGVGLPHYRKLGFNHQFKGRLKQLTDERDRVRILVDLNVPLSLLMEKEEYAMSELDIGDTVFIEFPEGSIQFI